VAFFRSGILVIALGMLAACDESVTGPTVPVGQSFELAPGGTASIAGAMSVRFDGVTGDSRCPADAICVWGGDAIVHITVLGGGGSPYELHTGSMAPVRHGDSTITLVQLVPYPFSGRTIPPGEYRATLRVTR
jgi:hypothetical protein